MEGGSKVINLWQIFDTLLQEGFGLGDGALAQGLLVQVEHVLHIGALSVMLEVQKHLF